MIQISQCAAAIIAEDTAAVTAETTVNAATYGVGQDKAELCMYNSETPPIYSAKRSQATSMECHSLVEFAKCFLQL